MAKLNKHRKVRRPAALLLAFIMVVMAAGFGPPAAFKAYAGPVKPAKGDGSAGTPYLIENADHLAWLAEAVNNGADDTDGGMFYEKYYKLENNIDLAGYGNGTGWIPIGTESSPFQGVFNGNGKTIKNLKINNPAQYKAVGLFGFVEGGGIMNATIIDVGLADVSIANNQAYYTGGIAGSLNGSASIKRCFVSGSVAGSLPAGDTAVGGIAGYVLDDGVVSDCYSAAMVSGHESAGGVAGRLDHRGEVTRCYATGDVKSVDWAGGVVGWTRHGSVQRSYALNRSVKTEGVNAGRVTSENAPGLSNNYGLNTMPANGGVPWEDKELNLRDGKDIGAEALRSGARWDGWDENVWHFAKDHLPTLKSVPASSDPSGSIPKINVTHSGFSNLKAGSMVNNAAIIFTLSNAVYASQINAGEFGLITGLPAGLIKGNAVRTSATAVTVQITGAPLTASEGEITLQLPKLVSADNITDATLEFNNPTVEVTGTVSFTIAKGDVYTPGNEGTNALVAPRSAVFDLFNRGANHMDVNVTLSIGSYAFKDLYYGGYKMIKDKDYIQTDDTKFRILSSFLSKLPAGVWKFTFDMSGGAKPELFIEITDSTPVEEEPFTDPGPAPTIPPPPSYPDGSWIFLSGGKAVNPMNFRFTRGYETISPVLVGNEAYMDMNCALYEHLSWYYPNGFLVINSSLAALHIPLNILDIAAGSKTAIAFNRIDLEDAYLRIRVIDRSDDANINRALLAIYPMASAVSPLVEFRMEIINAWTNEVIHVVREFTQPIEIISTIMPLTYFANYGSYRFENQLRRLEFVPHRTVNRNEMVSRSIFTGVHGIIANNITFSDIPENHWAYYPVHEAAYKGLAGSGGAFNPNRSITRAEFVHLITNALQLPAMPPGHRYYDDVFLGDWYYDGVSRARNAGLLWFYNDLMFRPGEPVTRQEAAGLLAAAVQYNNPQLYGSPSPGASLFNDSGLIDTMFTESVRAVISHDIMGGFDEYTFRPWAPVSRIEAVVMVINLAKVLQLID